jgi:2-polyprenyl-3-methyl-5-hydroxy-6-metoxy-1,4-benzoquinol methylase
MTEDIGLKWDSKYQSKNIITNSPSSVLTTNLHLLPDQGSALDLACGPGGNALVLAENGLETSAWDLSGVALSHLNQTAKSRKVSITIAHRDVVNQPPDSNSFDVIVVSNFLERSLIPAIISALKNNGLVFYQTFTKQRVTQPAPVNPNYKLDQNELLRLFAPLSIKYYREDGNSGDNEEFQGIAMLVAQKSI